MHFEPKVGSFAGSFANPCEHRVTTVRASDPSDQLLENNRFSKTCTTEQTSLTTADERGQQIDNLDTGFENFSVGGEFGNCGSLTVNRPSVLRLDVASLIDRLTKYVEHAT